LLSAIALLQPPCNSLTFTASGHVQDFHPIDIEHAEHTKKEEGKPSSFHSSMNNSVTVHSNTFNRSYATVS
ncbi:MAG: hypothetical protein II944_00645, partial [Ruminobacter sp.]|nr:hypothetical protein [Ruminobacter sp.]